MSSVKPEELSIMGLILLLFGISWIAFAWIQPVPETNCSTGTVIPSVPMCGFPGINAQLFYALGIPTSLIGFLMLYFRWYNYVRPGRQTTAAVIQLDRTPASFLKKCPNCGRELPIAAEKCYSCGANV